VSTDDGHTDIRHVEVRRQDKRLVFDDGESMSCTVWTRLATALDRQSPADIL